jgi:hypothetical protein
MNPDETIHTGFEQGRSAGVELAAVNPHDQADPAPRPRITQTAKDLL